jgi:hypothetical protein
VAVMKGSVIVILNRTHKVYHVNETCFLTLSGVSSISHILFLYEISFKSILLSHHCSPPVKFSSEILYTSVSLMCFTSADPKILSIFARLLSGDVLKVLTV